MSYYEERFRFVVVNNPNEIQSSGRNVAYLVDDDWNDFGYETMYKLYVFDSSGQKNEIGYLKIAKFDMEKPDDQVVQTDLPKEFTRLSEQFFSLGQEPEYYNKLKQYEKYFMKNILESLNDIVHDKNLQDKAFKEDVTNKSLLRTVSKSEIDGQFERILDKNDFKRDYEFDFILKNENGDTDTEFEFRFDSDAIPSKNTHCLIGENGVGKTFILNQMAKSLLKVNTRFNDSTKNDSTKGDFIDYSSESEKGDLFSEVVYVSFSAFDSFDLNIKNNYKKDFSYIGLKKTSDEGRMENPHKTLRELRGQFKKSFKNCLSPDNIGLFEKCIKQLEKNKRFNDIGFSNLIKNRKPEKDEQFSKNAFNLYEDLSSGHKIVSLIITRLIDEVEEKTLVLIDEPEVHFHPPLLTSFHNALSTLLSHRNGVAILATHSPVVLQEIPSDCVWKLKRDGLSTNATKPGIETFGANIGKLTREVFGLEVTKKKYDDLLKKIVNENPNIIDEVESFDQIINMLDSDVGSEGRAILKSVISQKKKE